MESIRALERLSSYTTGQWGMVTTRQALSLGIDEVTLHRLRAGGLLEAVRRGVHAATAAAASDARPEQAAWLGLHPEAAAWERPKLDPDGGVISHQSAARLHGLGDLPNTRVEITVPRRRTTRDPELWLRRAELTDADVTLLDGLPVTTPLRTIRDLLDRHTDASHIATIILQAVEARLVTLDSLTCEIKPYARRYGVMSGNGTELLTQLLAQIGVSLDELAGDTKPPARAWAGPENTPVTWGQLAKVAPEIAQRLLDNTTPDENDETR